MACSITKSKGLILGYDTTSGGTFATTLGGITDLKGFGVKGSKEECTTYSTTGYASFTPGAFGELEDGEMTLQYSKTQSTTIKGLLDTVKYFRVTYADGSYWTVEGWISDMGDETPLKGQISTKIKIMCTGTYFDWHAAT